ncbi:ribonuclease H-like protein [Rickenella mellea]|uniref:Ribonuclease H-like protein n=1 Tax=Rickenella mellea TaxID=50990 RepID=A0A4Y7PR99_9AGAM|nr:ribonuclease H-like protein [Rickenella mellea]
MSKARRNVVQAGATAKRGLLTPQNSFIESAETKPDSDDDRLVTAKHVSKPPPRKRKRTPDVADEDEAADPEETMKALEQEASTLEAKAKKLREKADSMRKTLAKTESGSDGEEREEDEDEEAEKKGEEVQAVTKTRPTVSPSRGPMRPMFAQPDVGNYLVWFDLETTDALKPPSETMILEVAVRITDKNFNPIDEGISRLVHWPQSTSEIVNEMIPIVREMHQKSGLINDHTQTPLQGRRTLQQVEDEVVAYLKRHRIFSRAIMAGAGVSFDRTMVCHWMKKLDAMLNYQTFDTTTLWHLVKRKYNRPNRFKGITAHRAMSDIEGSMREAKLYADVLLKAPSEVQWPVEYQDGV